jgi:DNA-binding transcriptional ArsR family regulator
MEVSELVELLTKVSGLDANQAKTAIYYAAATYHIKIFDWFPVLAFIGPPGTGKSKALSLMSQLCCKPFWVSCHATMTAALLRDQLTPTNKVTAIIEEGDLYPNRKQLQGYIINRVDRIRTSSVLVKEQVETQSGVKGWRTVKKGAFGATVLHDRNSLDDLAAESRVITITTTYRSGNFIEPPKGLVLPQTVLGTVPDYFSQSGRAFDTWKPLIMIASGLDDEDWLNWTYIQIDEATKNLRDGHAYEEKLVIFAKVIEAFCDNAGMLLVKEPLTLDKNVTDPLRKTTMPHITPHLVRKTLERMGLTVKRRSGTNKLYTSLDELKKVAKEIGYEDESLN